MDWVAQELGFEQRENWYQVTKKVIQDKGGGGLLAKYKDSTFHLLQSVYSEHSWLPWKFKTLPKGYWNKREHQQYFLDWFSKEYKIQKLENWYSVTEKDIEEIGGGGLLSKYEFSLPQLLKVSFLFTAKLEFHVISLNGNINPTRMLH